MEAIRSCCDLGGLGRIAGSWGDLRMPGGKGGRREEREEVPREVEVEIFFVMVEAKIVAMRGRP